MKRDVIEKLEFGCPFKPGTIGEKDAEMAEVVMQEGADEIKRLRAEVTRLTHDLANERVVSGYAKQLKEELDRLREEAESTLAFYAEKGRVVVARDGNAVQRLGASAEIAILKAEAERDKYKVALELIAGDPEWRTHDLATEREEVERLKSEVSRLEESNRFWKAQNDENAQAYSDGCEVNRQQWESLQRAKADRDKYKAALEGAIKKSGGGETYLREGVAKILSAEAVQS